MNTESAISSAASPSAINAGDEPTSFTRKLSIDVFRGMVMFLMLAEVMHLFDLA